jgi:hypothetical protein
VLYMAVTLVGVIGSKYGSSAGWSWSSYIMSDWPMISDVLEVAPRVVLPPSCWSPISRAGMRLLVVAAYNCAAAIAWATATTATTTMPIHVH